MPLVQCADAEANQDALLYPSVHAPSAIDLLSGANLAMGERLAKSFENGVGHWDFVGAGAGIKQSFNVFPQTCRGQ